MNKLMRDKLEDWLGKHFCTITETTGTMVCGLRFAESGVKREIAIAFDRYHHGDDPSEYVVGDKGFVVVLPSFWLGIPKELVIPYIENIIDAYLAEYIYGPPKKPIPGPPPPPSQVPVAVPGAPCPYHPSAVAGENKPFGVRTEHGDLGVSEDAEAQKLVKQAAAHSNFVNIRKADDGES